MRLAVRVLGLVLSLLSGAAWAVQAPVDVVRQTTDQVVERLKAEHEAVNSDPNRAYTLIEEIVLPHFDFDRMASWVLGKHWRTASPAQRERFIKEFRILLLRTYTRAIVDNVDQKIDYLPVRAESGATDVTVRTEVQQPGSFPIPIHYSMYLADNAWRVYDVNIDGISLVANYRTTFAGEIRQGDLDQLIDKLALRNNQAANE